MAQAGTKKSVLTHRSMVQQWECDHMGHMNVRHYMARFDDAAWNFLSEIGLDKTYFEERNGGVAAVDHHITYMRELRAGEGVKIHSHLDLLKGKKFRLIHEMVLAKNDEAVAKCEILGVHMDKTTRRAVAFPDDILVNGQPYLAE